MQAKVVTGLGIAVLFVGFHVFSPRETLLGQMQTATRSANSAFARCLQTESFFRGPKSRSRRARAMENAGLTFEFPKDSVTKGTTIDVPISHAWHVITDFEDYPTWTGAVFKATTLEDDDQGRAKVVKFDAGALGLTASYTLSYRYAENVLTWESVAGTVKKIVGTYELTPNGKATEVTYSLGVDIGFYLPGYLKRALTKLVISTALGELRRYAQKTYVPLEAESIEATEVITAPTDALKTTEPAKPEETDSDVVIGVEAAMRTSAAAIPEEAESSVVETQPASVTLQDADLTSPDTITMEPDVILGVSASRRRKRDIVKGWFVNLGRRLRFER